MNNRLRFSNLKQFAKSPAHYRAAVTGDGRYDSPAMRIGRLVHAGALGQLDSIVRYDGERRGKAWTDFAAAHEGREIVTAAEWGRAEPIIDAVASDPLVRPFLASDTAVMEHRIEWELDGRPCASTPDLYDSGHGVLLDLKTTADASPYRFGRMAIAMHYHAQLAFYRECLRTLGVAVDHALLVAVETSAPYCVTVHRLTPRALDEGWKLCRAWLERLAVCEASDVWPGYSQSMLDLDADTGLALSIDGEEVEL